MLKIRAKQSEIKKWKYAYKWPRAKVGRKWKNGLSSPDSYHFNNKEEVNL